MKRLFIQIDIHDASKDHSKEDIQKACDFALKSFDTLDPRGAPSSLELMEDGVSVGKIHITMSE